jgi:hypothetical protein
VIRAVAARDDHAVELRRGDRVGFGVDGDGIAVLALVGVGAPGADHEHVRARLA